MEEVTFKHPKAMAKRRSLSSCYDPWQVLDGAELRTEGSWPHRGGDLEQPRDCPWLLHSK